MGPNEREMLRLMSGVESFVIAGAIEFARGVVELNNEGGDSAPPAPIDTGELRGSVRITIGQTSAEQSSESPPYPLTRPSDVARAVQLGGFDLGDTLYETWIAAHATIIELGRQRDKNGRMIGSEQAPDGWLWPAVETQLSRMDSWRYKA